jgi:hypothetical protein
MPGYEEKLMSIAAQEWKAEWKEQGRVEGLAEGQAMALMRILERRFGPAPGTVRARIAAAAPGEILQWLDRVIDAASLEEVFTATH